MVGLFVTENRGVTEIPCRCTSLPKAHTKFSQKLTPLCSLIMAKANKLALVSAAINAFRRGEYAIPIAIAKGKGCHPMAIQRRLRGLTKTRREANLFWHQALINTQEELLISQINFLTDKGIPPTSQFIRNLAKEIRGKNIRKN